MKLDFEKAFALRDELVLPTFLGIGAQKGGTTWLWKNLEAIDSVHMPKKKETHFFDRKIDRHLRRYSKLFEPGAGMVRGEITPAYSVLPLSRIRYIAAAMPDVRLVLLIRNPIDRAWSHARMAMPIQADLPMDQIPIEQTLEYLMRKPQIDRGMYMQMIEKWTTPFEDDQLFVGFYDDISERPKDLLISVLGHIGATGLPAWDQMPWGEVIHGGRSADMPDELRYELSRLYEDEIHRCIDILGAPNQWADAIVER